MKLDIKTPKGRKSLADEREAIDKFEGLNPGYWFLETPKLEPAVVDGVFYKEGVLNSVVEVKVRNMTHKTLKEDYDDEWLVTADKIERGRRLSQELRIPFVGFLYLLPERRLFTLSITDKAGEYRFEFRTEETKTQKCCNGGEAVRLNAFLPMKTAKEHRGGGNRERGRPRRRRKS